MIGAYTLLKLDKVQNQGQQYEQQSDPLGCLSQLLVQTAFGLGQEGLSTAGDCTGQTGLLTGLEQNNCDKEQSGKNLNDGEDNSHLFSILSA